MATPSHRVDVTAGASALATPSGGSITLHSELAPLSDVMISHSGLALPAHFAPSVDDKSLKRLQLAMPKWPPSTHAACLYCAHTFSSPPLFLPTSMHPWTFLCEGVFCCFPCLIAHAQQVNVPIDRSFTLSMIFELAAQCGWSQDRLKPAPSKSLLKLFGGTLGIEEFRRVCGNVDIDITLQSFPFVANPAFIVSQKLNGVDSGPIIPGTVHGAIPFPTQTQIADKMRARVEPPRTDALFDEFVKGMEVVDEDEMP